jgi:ATP-dependent DNA ligase
MLSSAADALPQGEGWHRSGRLSPPVFRDGEEILLQSRDEKPMNRYFPELLAPLAASLPERCVVDGEIVIVGKGCLDFEALLLRIHPAASRVKLLSEQSPVSYVAWDLLALGDEDLRRTPLAQRRERLSGARGAAPPVHLSPATRDRAPRRGPFRRPGAGADGVMAKA